MQAFFTAITAITAKTWKGNRVRRKPWQRVFIDVIRSSQLSIGVYRLVTFVSPILF